MGTSRQAERRSALSWRDRGSCAASSLQNARGVVQLHAVAQLVEQHVAHEIGGRNSRLRLRLTLPAAEQLAHRVRWAAHADAGHGDAPLGGELPEPRLEPGSRLLGSASAAGRPAPPLRPLPRC